MTLGFYKYVGDDNMPPGDNSFIKMSLKKPIPLFSGEYSELYVSFLFFIYLLFRCKVNLFF